MFISPLLSLLLPTLVSAHGFVYHVSIDGKDYPGNSVGTTATVKSPIRQVNTNGPVKGASNPDIACGPGAQPAADTATANPGSNVQVYWCGGVSGCQSWPHVVGPIMHYMAMCTGPCSSYDPSSAKWFKVAEADQKSGGSSWYMSDLHNGSPANLTIPNELAPGNYMLRSELISLQGALSPGGAEFYESCIQLAVGGSQTGQPSASDLVSFPGAYHDNDAGILVPDVYNPGFHYQPPGPSIANLNSGGGTGTGSAGGSGNSTSSTPSSPPPSSSSASMSTSPMPTMPANAGDSVNPSNTNTSSVSYPTSTGGSGSSTCKRKKRSIPEPQTVVPSRMHRRHNRFAH